MNFDNCALYVDRLLASAPDDPTEKAGLLAAWFFEESLRSVEEFTDDADKQLHLMGAPGACCELLLLTASNLPETMMMTLGMSDDEPYAGQFAWDEDVREMEPGRTQAHHLADLFLSDPENKPSDWPAHCSQIGMILLALVSVFKMPDQKTIALSLVGAVPELLSNEVREKIADGIMEVFRKNGVEIENTMININQTSN
jgi:hypothetical protein